MIVDWWDGIVRWTASDDGWQVVTGAILPFVAILAAGLIAGWIARGSVKRLIAQQDRQHKAAAVTALIASGRQAATWSVLSATEKDHVDRQASEAEVRVRLLPVDGAGLAADWAAHYLATLRRNSANFSFHVEQDLADLQDGLIAWQKKPGKARRLFAQDLAAWKYETPSAEDELVAKQREWAAQHAEASVPVPEPAER